MKRIKRYELSIAITNPDYTDALIVALARQGYSPYLGDRDAIVCIEISSNDLIEIRHD